MPQPSETEAGAAATTNRLFTWPHLLFIAVIVYTCYHRIRHDVTQLPDYILIIESVGMCVWLLPFALFYNIIGSKLTKVAYIAANIGFVLIFLALAALG